MKLAEALILRADLQTRQEQLRQRLAGSALVQEGETPAENPQDLLSELETSCNQLEKLMAQINLTNAAAVTDGKTLTEHLARREVLTRRISIMRSLLEQARQPVMRGTRTEVRIRSTVSVAALQKQVDDLSRELRILDTAIQSANWLIELKE